MPWPSFVWMSSLSCVHVLISSHGAIIMPREHLSEYHHSHVNLKAIGRDRLCLTVITAICTSETIIYQSMHDTDSSKWSEQEEKWEALTALPLARVTLSITETHGVPCFHIAALPSLQSCHRGTKRREELGLQRLVSHAGYSRADNGQTMSRLPYERYNQPLICAQ